MMNETSRISSTYSNSLDSLFQFHLHIADYVIFLIHSFGRFYFELAYVCFISFDSTKLNAKQKSYGSLISTGCIM